MHRGVLEALAYAKSLRPNHLLAVTVVSDEEEQEKIEAAWADYEHRRPARDRLLARTGSSPGPSCASSTSSTPSASNDIVTVVIPEFVVELWWGQLLHNQSALFLKGRLLFRKDTVVTSVPYHVMIRPGPRQAGILEPTPAAYASAARRRWLD